MARLVTILFSLTIRLPSFRCSVWTHKISTPEPEKKP